MFINSLIYLLEIYWPFALAALLAGLATGWWSLPAKKD